MRIVFDLDDTISVHQNRDYANAQPIRETIEKIRRLKADGCEIVIYTARGQNSCKGDINLIEKRNREQIERWLTEHDVPCDSLIFGKPLGDLYVDDKGVSLDSFLTGKYEHLRGNSGAEIYRLGNKVSKKCDDAQQQAEWYAKAQTLAIDFLTPKVYSVVLDTITLEYIEGNAGYKKPLSNGRLCSIFCSIARMRKYNTGCVFDVQALLKRAEEHLESTGHSGEFARLFAYLKARKRTLSNSASFCHGDLSLSNMIFAEEKVWVIDPIIKGEYSSFLLDLAKFRFSLNGGEEYLHGAEAADFRENLAEYDAFLKCSEISNTTKALEAIYWIRLLKYAKDSEHIEFALSKARELEAELW